MQQEFTKLIFGDTVTAALLFILVFLSETIGTLSGFGSSVFFVPLAGMLYDFKTTLVLTSIMHIFSTSTQMFLFRKEIDWKLLIKIGVPSLFFVMLGAYLSDKVDLKYAQMIMGLFLVVFALTFMLYPNLTFSPSTLNAIAGGVIAGFLAGLIGTGGAIRGATLAAFNLPKGAFVGTSAGIDFMVDVSRASIYLSKGYLEPKYYWYIPFLLITATIGALLGKKILKSIPQKIFKLIVLLIILLVGLFMVYEVIIGNQVVK